MFFDKTVLPNGITVATERMDAVRSAALGLWVRTGSRDEAPSDMGISHFMEHMIFKGTPTMSAIDISMAFDALGAEVNAFTSKESTCFYSRMRDEKLSDCFKLLADMLVNASFTTECVETEREVVLEEIARSVDTPDDYIYDVFTGAVFPEDQLGKPVLGAKELVAGFTGADLRRYHNKNYTASNVFVVACGNVDHSQVVELTEKYLSGLSVGVRKERSFKDAASTPKLTSLKKDSEQAHMIVGCPSLPANSPKRYAHQLLLSALGGGMSSRLFNEIREKRGLAYSVYAMSQAFEGAGQFMVYAGTRPENVATVRDLILREFDKFAQDGVTDDELERVREMVCGSYVLSMESPRTHMVRLGKMLCDNREEVSLDQTLNAYREVTKEQVNEAAVELFNKSMTTAVISPYEEEALKEMFV